MNRIILAAGSLAWLANPSFAGERVEQRETWTESFPVTVTKPKLTIENIWGDVRVRPGDTGEIVVTITEQRSAPDQERFDRSLETLNLTTDSDENGVAFHVGNRDGHWHGRDLCRNCRVDYRFDVRVPADTQLDVSTVNDGEINISGIAGLFSAANVNGPITASGVHDCSDLNNVNGQVSIGFAAPPDQNCTIETVNGDITLTLPERSNFDLAMNLFNGRMLTELPVDPLALPARVEHIESDGRNQYRIEQKAGLRFGAGGPQFTISSMNGDIRIQKIN